MKPTLFYSAEQSQAIDKQAIAEGTAGLMLMKRAAFFAFETLEKVWPDARKISLICGPGNNAGDGYAMAQFLAVAGFEVDVFNLTPTEKLQGDAKTCFLELQALGIKIQAFHANALQDADVIVDAIFGTGLNKPIQAPFSDVINQINASQKPILALDIPSGLDANTGTVLGCAINADHTCCFITQKIGLYSFQGTEQAGKIHFSRLGVTESLIVDFPAVAQNHPLKHWLNELPKFKASSHKGARGTCCLIGGNHHMMGAIQLAGLACLKTGAGLVKIITQTEHCLPLTQALPELMAYDFEQLKLVLLSSRAVAIGPGLGQDAWAQNCLQQILTLPHPKVLDADALNLLTNGTMDLSNAKRNWVLTPHPTEAARLLNISTEQVQQDRIAAIRALHAQYQGVIVLKGNGTLIYDGESMELCTAGNAGMATGGMGDVLTGAIVSFLGQGMTPFNAACLGVALHAHAGDVLANQQGQAAVTPSDLASTLSQLLRYAG